jgi:hypothetical protein
MKATFANVGAGSQAVMTLRQLFQFFILVPVAVGLSLGAASVGFQQFVTVGHHMTYMVAFAVLSWICYGLGAKLTSLVLRPWHPRLLLVLVAGHIVGGFGLWWSLRDLLNLGFESYLAPGSSFGPFWPPPKDNLGQYVAISLQGMAWWVFANWVDFRYRRVPRFGFAPSSPPTRESGHLDSGVAANEASPDPARTVAVPRLAVRLPEELQVGEILALEAEEHYTKVHTSAGNALLLLRFSDAIAEMEPLSGLQVHRSFWVSHAAVERLERIGRRTVIRLRGGGEIPVSRSYRLQVRDAGFPTAAPQVSS